MRLPAWSSQAGSCSREKAVQEIKCKVAVPADLLANDRQQDKNRRVLCVMNQDFEQTHHRLLDQVEVGRELVGATDVLVRVRDVVQVLLTPDMAGKIQQQPVVAPGQALTAWRNVVEVTFDPLPSLLQDAGNVHLPNFAADACSLGS